MTEDNCHANQSLFMIFKARSTKNMLCTSDLLINDRDAPNIIGKLGRFIELNPTSFAGYQNGVRLCSPLNFIRDSGKLPPTDIPISP